MGYTYDNRGAVATMVYRAIAAGDHYDIDAIIAHLHMKTDADSGFMDVTVGEFWDVIDSNRLDIPQLRAAVALVNGIAKQTDTDVWGWSYRRHNDIQPVATTDLGDEEAPKYLRVEVISTDTTSPIVNIYEVANTFEEPESKTLILGTGDATQGLAKLAELLT